MAAYWQTGLRSGGATPFDQNCAALVHADCMEGVCRTTKIELLGHGVLESSWLMARTANDLDPGLSHQPDKLQPMQPLVHLPTSIAGGAGRRPDCPISRPRARDYAGAGDSRKCKSDHIG